MRIETWKLSEMNPAPYNPRKKLVPGDPEYEALKRSIMAFDYVDPIIVNKRTKRIVGGHQRYRVLMDLGWKEASVSVVDLDEDDEKLLNLALNRVQGAWDEALLAQLLAELRTSVGIERLELSGFLEDEIDELVSALSTWEDAESNSKQRKNRPGAEDYAFRFWHAIIGNEPWLPRARYLLSWVYCNEKSVTWVKESAKELFVDSGFLTGVHTEGKAFLKRQKQMLRDAERFGADWVAMMDVPIIPEVMRALKASAQKCLELHLIQAKEFASTDVSARRVWVVQGYELPLYEQCCNEMARLEAISSEDVIAIGGLKNRSDDVAVISEVTKLVHEAFPHNILHLFGVATAEAIVAGWENGVRSWDAATAAHTSIHGRIPYGMDKSMDLEEMMGGPWRISQRLRGALYGLVQEILEMRVARALVSAGMVADEELRPSEGVDGDNHGERVG